MNDPVRYLQYLMRQRFYDYLEARFPGGTAERIYTIIDEIIKLESNNLIQES